MTSGYTVARLDRVHDRASFTCGSPPLDRYLREQASQDVKRRVANCFVALDAPGALVAYYTLASTGVALTDLPPETARLLPRYPLVPAALIGRLAVDRRHQGRGLGGALILDAATRAAGAEPAVFALIVEAKDEAAAMFYRHLGFTTLASRPGTLFLPIATALSAFA